MIYLISLPLCSVWPDVPVGYSESDYKKPICKVRVQCTRSLASEYKLDTEPASRLHLEHYTPIKYI